MKKMKKSLAALLAIVMVLSMLPLTAFAEPEENTEVVTVSGTVVTEKGIPLANITINAYEEDNPSQKTATTAEDGTFSIEIGKDIQTALVFDAGEDYEKTQKDVKTSFNMKLGDIVTPYKRYEITVTPENCSLQYKVTGIEPTAGVVEEKTTVKVRKNDSIEFAAVTKDGCSFNSYVERLEESELVVSTDAVYKVESIDAAHEYRVVCKDVTAPTITITGVSEQDEWAKDKTIDFTAADNITASQDVEVYVSDTEYELTDTDAIRASMRVDGRVLATKNGTYYVYAVDGSMNAAIASVEITKIDRESPVIGAMEADSVGWAKQVTYTFTVTDNGELTEVIWSDSVNTEPIIPAEDGIYSFTVDKNGEITVTAKDAAGNETTATTQVSNVDTVSPEITKIIVQNTWAATQNTVTYSAMDNVAITRMWYTNEAGEETTVPLPKDGQNTINVSENGEYTMHAEDAAGNSNSYAFTVNHIDSEAPSITAFVKEPSAEWTNTAVTIYATASDTQSGLSLFYWTDDDSAFSTTEWQQLPQEDGKGVLVIDNDTDLRAIYRMVAVDAVGNISAEKEMHVGIDVTEPQNFYMTFSRDTDKGFFETVGHFLSFGLLYKDKITVTMSAIDNYSGIAYYEYQIVGEGEELKTDAWTKKAVSDNEYEFSIEKDDFRGYIYGRVYDKMGNGTQYITDTENGETILVVLENTPQTYEERTPAPDLKVTSNSHIYTGEWTNNNVDIVVSGGTAISGTVYYQYQVVRRDEELNIDGDWKNLSALADGTARLTIDYDLNADIYVRSMSYAHNPSQYTSTSVKVQKTIPENAKVAVSGTANANAWYRIIPTITITEPQQDVYAAPVTTYYRLDKDDTKGAETVFNGISPVITGDGVYTLSVYTKDAAGNDCKQSYEKTIRVDTTAPTNLSIMNGESSVRALDKNTIAFRLFYKDPITLTFSANTDISGLQALEYQKVTDASYYSINGNWTEVPASGLSLTVEDGQFVIYLRATDMAGNYTVVNTDGIIMDKRAPEGFKSPELDMEVIGKNKDGFFTGDAYVDIAAQDPKEFMAASGLKTIRYTVTCDGVVTQDETISCVNGRNEMPLTWNGRIKINANLNNSNRVVLSVTAVDNAGNSRTTTTKNGEIMIDTTAPSTLISYDNNSADTTFDTAYFKAGRTARIIVTERNFIPERVAVTATKNGAKYEIPLTWTQYQGRDVNGDDTIYVAHIPFTDDGVYTLSVKTTDGAGNTGEGIFDANTVAGGSFIVDKTAPVISVNYNNNHAYNGKYFQDSRTATVTVTEINFEPTRVQATITASINGRTITAPALTEWTSTGATHVAKIVYSSEGDYTFDMTYADMAGNEAKGVAYGSSVAPTAFTVDKTSVKCDVEGIANQTSYKDMVQAIVKYSDINLDSYNVTLYQTSREAVKEDVTDKYISEQDHKTQSGNYVFNRFEKERETDGIYVLTYSFTDMAGHTTAEEILFTVNRYGSVYVYNDTVIDLLNGYHNSCGNPLIITEINPNKLVKGSENVTITRDGEPVEAVWQVTPPAETEENIEHEWYEYTYVIDATNFDGDGKYNVNVSSEDEAGNQKESSTDNEEIEFWIDATAPEITSVQGMEHAIVNASSQQVKIMCYDSIGIDTVMVYLDGKEIYHTDEKMLANEYEAEVELPEGLHHHLQIVVTDMAGNIIDTDTKEYAPAFIFQKSITVSTNFFVRWYSNPWVFFGSLLGFALLGTGVTLAITKSRKKKRASTNEVID